MANSAFFPGQTLVSWATPISLLSLADVESRSRTVSDEQLVERILRTRNSSLYTVIVARYRSKLTALARTTLADSRAADDVDDVVQESFIAAYANLHTFRASAAFKPWLYRIMLNRCTDRLRQARRTVETFDFELYIDERATGPHESVVSKDERQRIDHAIDQLPTQLRVIFLLRHMDDLSYSDLAEATGLPLGTVKTHLFRARTRVKEILLQEDSQ